MIFGIFTIVVVVVVGPACCCLLFSYGFEDISVVAALLFEIDESAYSGTGAGAGELQYRRSTWEIIG